MGKNSKKRKAERKILRQAFGQNLQQSKLTNIANTIIPAEVALGTFNELAERQIDKEYFRLVFSTYNHSQCGLTQIQHSNEAKGLIKLLDKITNTSPSRLGESSIVRDNVNEDGPYKNLFHNLPKDIELKEAEFSGTGRLFFYIFRSMFCVVSITINHL